MESENTANLNLQLSKLLQVSIRKTAPSLCPDKSKPLIAACSDDKFGDYQCNNAMGLFKELKKENSPHKYKNPAALGEAIKENLPCSEMIESSDVKGPGFVNIVLSKIWMAQSIQKMLIEGIDTWAPNFAVKKVLIDFSSPNIAKEMHVGHLRSTIIGDTICRMLEFSKVDVLRRNHVGDWGTQFGMLIAYLFEECPNFEDVSEKAIGDLQAFYKKAKERFDASDAFKDKARDAVVKLQGGDPKYCQIWAHMCDISRKEFDKIYQRLGVHVVEQGESFYNPFIPKVIDSLSSLGLVKEDKGARVIAIEGYDKPFIVVKNDGGFNYASTDLAALWYRLNVEKAEWIIYVTDIGQKDHFDKFFKAAKLAGWLPTDDTLYPKASHVSFGLVLGDDGQRFRTRSSEVVRLVDLLDEAVSRSKAALIERGKAQVWTEEELEKAAECIGYGAVKYADLKNNRLTGYTFSFDEMLKDKGNTAVYLQYAHARICSIIQKSGLHMEELNKKGTLVLDHPNERALGLHLLRFCESVEEACTTLLPSAVCDYVYNLCEYFSRFYSTCQVVGSQEERSRVILCEATVAVMKKCFFLLGIQPLAKI